MDKCYESFKPEIRPVPGFDNFRSYIPATVTAPSIEIRSSADAYQFQWYQPEHIIVKLANGVSDWQSARLKDVEVFSYSGTWRCVRKRYTKRLRWNNSCHLYLKLEQSDTTDETTSIRTDNWGFPGWFPKTTNVSEIIGKWPGTDAEFDETMREIEKEREMCEETECVHLYGLAKECIGKHRNDFEPIENVVYLSEVARLSESDGFLRFVYCPRCGMKFDWDYLYYDYAEDDE